MNIASKQIQAQDSKEQGSSEPAGGLSARPQDRYKRTYTWAAAHTVEKDSNMTFHALELGPLREPTLVSIPNIIPV